MENNNFSKMLTIEQQYLLDLKTLGEVKLLNCLIATTGGAFHSVYYTNEQFSIMTGLSIPTVIRTMNIFKQNNIINYSINKKKVGDIYIPIRKISLIKEVVYASEEKQKKANEEMKKQWKELKTKNKEIREQRKEEKNKITKVEESLKDYSTFEF